MIAQFFKPDNIAEAVALKVEHGAKALYMGGGSKLNAATATYNATIAISLAFLNLNRIVRQGKELAIGATVTLQTLIEHADVPISLKEGAKLVYSRHLRNQATLGGEIAAKQDASVLLPILLVLEAELILESNQSISLEKYLASPQTALIEKIILPNADIPASTRKVSHTVDGLVTLTAAVALPPTGIRIALDGVAEHPIRLPQVEALKLEGEVLEKAVSEAIHPSGDILKGSSAYKSYIAGIAVADLLVNCQQQGRK